MSFGLLLIDKPSGPTSHDVVDLIRRGIRERRVGHAGTLDPLATGLLVIGLGPATRLTEYLVSKPKRYRAKIRFGRTTTTYDSQGAFDAPAPRTLSVPSRESLEMALPRFRGEIEQMPPAYSAIKRGGQKAYDLARRGEPVDLEPRTVEIYSLELVSWESPECTLDIECSAGTYIRSLAHDIGQALKSGAYVTGLRRTTSGNFSISEAVTLDELQKSFMSREWKKYLLPADAGLMDWPAINLPDESVKRVQHGQDIALTEADGDWGRAYDERGRFIAVLRADRVAGIWKPHKVLMTE